MFDFGHRRGVHGDGRQWAGLNALGHVVDILPVYPSDRLRAVGVQTFLVLAHQTVFVGISASLIAPSQLVTLARMNVQGSPGPQRVLVVPAKTGGLVVGLMDRLVGGWVDRWVSRWVIRSVE